MRSVGLKCSPLTCSFSPRRASAFPRLMLTLRPTTRCTIPVHHLFFDAIVLVVKYTALLLADLLKDDILGILRGDASEFLGADFHLEDIPELCVGVDFLRVHQGNLHGRVIYIFHDRSVRVHTEIAGLWIDGYMHIVRFSKMVLASLDQGLLNGFQKGVLTDIFFFPKYPGLPLTLCSFLIFPPNLSNARIFKTQWPCGSGRYPFFQNGVPCLPLGSSHRHRHRRAGCRKTLFVSQSGGRYGFPPPFP